MTTFQDNLMHIILSKKKNKSSFFSPTEKDKKMKDSQTKEVLYHEPIKIIF